MSLPELFGDYLLHHRLADGTTSEVFLAQTTGAYPRLCAVKRIRAAIAALPRLRYRLPRRSQASGSSGRAGSSRTRSPGRAACCSGPWTGSAMVRVLTRDSNGPLLVAPVTEKGASSRRFYLPRGAWYDFWTEEKVEGGREVSKAVDLGRVRIMPKSKANVCIVQIVGGTN